VSNGKKYCYCRFMSSDRLRPLVWYIVTVIDVSGDRSGSIFWTIYMSRYRNTRGRLRSSASLCELSSSQVFSSFYSHFFPFLSPLSILEFLFLSLPFSPLLLSYCRLCYLPFSIPFHCLSVFLSKIPLSTLYYVRRCTLNGCELCLMSFLPSLTC
jgi:hypothetical protein